MIKEIVKNTNILEQTSARFEFGTDEYLIQDMIDTAEHHKDLCVGLACIQIGVPKRVILVKMGHNFIPFINPKIIQKFGKPRLFKEGCMSLDGLRPVLRYSTIKVAYTTKDNKQKIGTFRGITAQIIQHEVDHLDGVLI